MNMYIILQRVGFARGMALAIFETLTETRHMPLARIYHQVIAFYHLSVLILNTLIRLYNFNAHAHVIHVIGTTTTSTFMTTETKSLILYKQNKMYKFHNIIEVSHSKLVIINSIQYVLV